MISNNFILKITKKEKKNYNIIYLEDKLIEPFNHNKIGYSLDEFHTDIIFTFPGEYKETIYRPSTITPIITEMVSTVINPIIKYLNNSEGYNFVIGSYIYISCREYKTGTIYIIELMLIDGIRPISIIMKLEFIISLFGIQHINYIGFNIMPNSKYADKNYKVTNVKDLKKHILPN